MGISGCIAASYLMWNIRCSCLINNTCVHQAGIYNWTGRRGVHSGAIFGDLTFDPPLLLTIPGLMVGCLPYNSLFRSTLECFYNQSCIDQIQIFINGLSLVTPLSLSCFKQNTTVSDLFDNLFIESWNEKINFTGYFQVCSPHSCTYSYDRRFNLLYVIVTIISLFGGLKTILYFSTPLIIMFIRRIQKRILVLVFYSSIAARIRINNVYQPSLNEYERLYTQYSSTLVCPCTHLSVSYSSIMYIKPYYHQVCSSDFIKDNAWLLYFRGLPDNLHALDFRVRGSRIFTTLQTLCKMSNDTVTNELVVFNNLQFVSSQVLTKNTFNTETSALIQQFQQQLNQFIVYGGANAQIVQILNDNNNSMRFVSNNDWNNQCSCGTNVSCTRSEGFYLSVASYVSYTGTSEETIPGLVVGCVLVDSLLASSLECFYNALCIQRLIKLRSYDLYLDTVDSRVANVVPLDPTVDSRFSPDTTLDQIVSQLFVEGWTNSTNFSFYYRQCAPYQCIRHKIAMFCARFQHSIRTMNLYHKVQKPCLPEKSQTTNDILIIQRQQIATRFYIIVFVLALIVIITFTGLNSQIHSVKVTSPTELIFKELQTQYSSSLSCPCSRIAIQYSKFLSVKPIAYHQVCSSYFISSNFIELLWGTEFYESYYWNVDMKILSTQFRLLASFCSLVKNLIEQKIEIFSSQKFISVEALTRHSFQTQIDSIIDHFIVQAPTSFRQIHKYIIEMFHANQLHNIFYTNWNLTISNPNDNYIMSTSPISYNDSNSSCSCATMSTCSRSLLTNNNKTEILSGKMFIYNSD
ncbi:unnamed protein product [Rotaria sp. Silwood1]|nr:unnamed protein product [Rotaria sp. Silwood1]